MKVLILGSGIIGVTTAYFLNKAGHEVTVVDREPASARQCSFANGGQLSYSHAEPWANPGAIKKAMKWIWQKDAPLQLRPNADPHMWAWAIKFLFNCGKDKSLYNTKNILRLDFYSRDVLHSLLSEVAIEFDHKKKGKMHIFKSHKDFEAAIEHSDFQCQFGDVYEKLTPDECVKKEPALRRVKEQLVGGLFSPNDESGDIHAFTTEFAKKESESGVKFLYGTDIKEVITEGDSILGIQTDNGILKADSYVMALGAYSSVYLRKIGINVPIYPMKGYSISIPLDEKSLAPEVSITDQSEKVVYSRFRNILRVAGTAEFAGYNHDVTPRRIAHMKKIAKELFPQSGDVEKATSWACLRPSTPDGPPILGTCKYKNLFLNTGHGTLGWTQALGSARIVSDIMNGKKPEIDMTGLTIERY